MKITRRLFLFVAFLLTVNLGSVPNATSGPGSETIKLPQPSFDDGVSVERALQDRRSVRNFSSSPLALKDLSQLLWAAQGITGPDSRRTSPSAGALYPLEVYVIAGRVAGLDPGIYTYKPEGHGLLKISDGDARADLSTAAHSQTSVRSAPAVLVISAVYERTMVKNGERGIRFAQMEAGHAAQNVCLQAVARKLGSVVVGGFDDDAVRKAAHLTVREEPLYLIPVGKPQGQ